MVEIARMEASGKNSTKNEIIKKALELVTGGGSDLDKAKKLLARVEELHEFNPMLGHRGCRLASLILRSPKCRPKPSSRPPASW